MKNYQERVTKVRRESSIQCGVLYFEDARQCSIDDAIAADILDDAELKAVRVVSLNKNWMSSDWVTYDSKASNAVLIEMTLRKEIRRGIGYWYAYRRFAGKLHKRYVGGSENITNENLLKIAQALPGIGRAIK